MVLDVESLPGVPRPPFHRLLQFAPGPLGVVFRQAEDGHVVGIQRGRCVEVAHTRASFRSTDHRRRMAARGRPCG